MNDSVLIETERLRLRTHRADDAEEWFLLNSDPEVIKYTGNSPFESVEEARKSLQNYLSEQNPGFGRLAVELKETSEYIGWCGLKQHDGFVDLGYRLHQKHWGKGYASEAAEACLNHGFNSLNLRQIIGRSLPENVASIRILEKLGMTYLGMDTAHGDDEACIFKMEQWEHRTRSNG